MSGGTRNLAFWPTSDLHYAVNRELSAIAAQLSEMRTLCNVSGRSLNVGHMPVDWLSHNLAAALIACLKHRRPSGAKRKAPRAQCCSLIQSQVRRRFCDKIPCARGILDATAT